MSLKVLSANIEIQGSLPETANFSLQEDLGDVCTRIPVVLHGYLTVPAKIHAAETSEKAQQYGVEISSIALV